jgi:hypothetical protein
MVLQLVTDFGDQTGFGWWVAILEIPKAPSML